MREAAGTGYGLGVPRNPQGMTKWITHRLPTGADTDSDGEVEVPRYEDSTPGADSCFQHYSLIVPGQPWWPSDPEAAGRAEAEQYSAEAKPAPKPKYSEAMEQARLEHLRAKALLLQAQALAFTRIEPGTPRIDLASMPYKPLLRLLNDVVVELSAREAL
jgi:hypothetical protein